MCKISSGVISIGLLILGGTLSSCKQESLSSYSECLAGETSLCDCPDGSNGVKICEDDNIWGDCGCDDPGVDTDPCGDGLLLVVDRSGSMNEPDGEWEQFVSVISDSLAQVESGIDVGLVVFPDTTCNGGYSGTDMGILCRSPDNVEVDIAGGAVDSIVDSLNEMGTCGGTPIAGAISKAATSVSAYGGNVQVVLIADGVPNCNMTISDEDCECSYQETAYCDDHPELCVDSADTIEATEELRAAGGVLHVIGNGIDVTWAGLFDDIAQAGGTEQFEYCTDLNQIGIELVRILNSITDC